MNEMRKLMEATKDAITERMDDEPWKLQDRIDEMLDDMAKILRMRNRENVRGELLKLYQKNKGFHR
jgi:hypothetical protein